MMVYLLNFNFIKNPLSHLTKKKFKVSLKSKKKNNVGVISYKKKTKTI